MKILSKATLRSITLFIVVLLIAGCGESYRHESTGQYVDNSAITLKVKSKLLADKSIESLPITVKSYKSEVQLSGFVNSRAQALRAAQLARSVKGVTSVKNNLIVK